MEKRKYKIIFGSLPYKPLEQTTSYGLDFRKGPWRINFLILRRASPAFLLRTTKIDFKLYRYIVLYSY